MTRLPADDSFFPSPALDTDRLMASTSGTPSAHASSSVISPLSLPGAAHYFDQPPLASVTSHPLPGANHNNFSLMTGETCGPPQAQPPNFLSPHLTPIPSHAQYQLQFQRHPQQRAASLSPTRRYFTRGSGKMDGQRSPDVDLPARSAPGIPVPVDTISGTGSGLFTIRRPALRSTSTENPSSAESQSLSLEARMRQAWDEERRALQANRDRAEELYRDATEALRSEHASVQSRWEAERYQLQTQITLLQNRLRKSEARWNETSLRGGGSDSQSVSFQGSSSSQLSPTALPECLLPLHNDNKSSSEQAIVMDHETPSKVIDVQEYHKDLEGIHLKVNAVKKATFTDTPSSNGSKPSSANGSPSHTPEERRELARERCARALKADPLSRLTMNAGHTPTVSMSFTSTGATNTVTSSGSNTPTLVSGDGAISSDGNDGNEDRESKEPAEPVGTAADDADHGPAIMEPSDEDPELKGPLTLRNIPAKDEIFLRKLADKLEKVGEDATPTVLKDVECDKGESSAPAAPVPAPADDSDGEETEPEIPLKLRSTSNFGKPLGSL